MKFSLLTLIGSAWSQQVSQLEDGPITVTPDTTNVKPGHVRVNLNIGEIKEELKATTEHQRLLRVPQPLDEDVFKAVNIAESQIAASSGRILDPSLVKVRKMVEFLDPTRKCHARKFAECLERTGGVDAPMTGTTDTSNWTGIEGNYQINQYFRLFQTQCARQTKC